MTRKQQSENRYRRNQEDITVGYHVVCLIDVLGQKQKLARWANLPEHGQITPDLVAALKQTVGVVLWFAEQFVILFREFGQCTIPDKLAALPKEKQEEYFRFRQCSVRVERFADTFVFSSQIANIDGDVSVIPLYGVLVACCNAMVVSLAAKVPVRGAVTIGTGGVLENGSFYGPALSDAHHLESEVAGYPRVVVAPSIRKFLHERRDYSRHAEINKAMEQMAAVCRSLVCQDIDGEWMVDFIGSEVRNLLGPQGTDRESAEAVKHGYEFVQFEAKRFRAAGTAKLAVRYHLLQRYMQSRLPLWGLDAGGA